MKHCQLAGLSVRKSVHKVEGKVEMLGVLKGDGGGMTGFGLLYVDVIVPDALLGILFCHQLGVLDLLGGHQFGNGLAGRVENDGVEGAILAAGCDHTVGCFTVVIDAVAGAENLAVLADLNHELSFDNDITFLTRVGGQLNVLVRGVFVVVDLNEQGFGNTVSEIVCHIVVGHAVCAGDLLRRAAAGHGIGAQLGAVSLNDIGYVDLESHGTAIDKGKVEVASAFLAVTVLLCGYVGFFRHFRNGVAFDLAQLTDASSHFLNFVIKTGDLFHF